ncbi:MAG TPA: aspartyl protease family protein [Opitutaceae bacterium]|nr:aspartyl protease family protein [Opitutaceae bacterium]
MFPLRLVFAAGLALLALAAPASPTTLRFDRGSLAPGQNAVPGRLVSNLLLVEGSVGGAGPYYFLVDTGSSVTLVSDRIAATVPGFRPNVGLAPVQVISAAGGATLLGSITVPSIELGGTGFATVRAAVYDFVDFSNHLGVTVDGILGFPVFRDVLLTLDYPRSRVVLSPRFPARAIPGIAVPFALEDGTRPIINVELGAATFMALIDSGSNLPFTLNATGLNPSFKYGPRTGPLVATLSGDAPRQIGRLAATLVLGTVEIREPRVMLTDQLPTIGAEILRHFTLTFDQHRGLVVLTPERDAPVKLPAQRTTGLSFARLPAEWRVLQVMEDAPATTQQIRPGDAIVGIDGEPIVKWNLDRFEKHLRTADTIEYLFRRDGRSYLVKVAVYDLVP